MKKRVSLGIVFLFAAFLIYLPYLSCNAVADEVILKHVDSFDPIIKELHKADSDVLVVFDVDYVLLVPKDLIARPASRELRHALFPKIEKKVGKDKFMYLSSILRLQGGSDLIDARLPDLVKGLQAHSVKVIALTAQGYGPFGIVKDEGALRVEELKKLGLDFRNAFPSLESFTLNIPSPKDQPPLYREGIIFTDRSSKGEALIAFLQKIKWNPKKIIVIDDGRQHLEHIQEALKANHLNGLLFLYIDGKLAAEKPDPELAQTQFDYLIKNEKWISDEEEQKQRSDNAVKQGAPLFNNLGNYHHPITTRSSLVQRYFDQGLLLFYGFDSGESIRSFREAIRLDPQCAMCYWGLALALGSKNNMPMDGRERQDANAAIKKAQQLVDPKNTSERAYIDALAQRYSSDTPSEQGNSSDIFTHGGSVATGKEPEAYATAMGKVVQKFPKDFDAKNLYAFSLFDVNQWKFWTRRGEPQPHTLDIIKTLKSVLILDPKNIAANHYYIHVIEQSQHPEHALASANFLHTAVPGAEHLLHMPSHIYLLTGRYHEASIANQTAIAAFKGYQAECRRQGFEPEVNYLYLHNLHFLSYSAMIEGRSALALKTAKELVQQTQLVWLKKDSYLQLFLPVPYFIEARFGKWDELFSEPKPAAEFQYAVGMWHYTRGIADLQLSKYNEAEKEFSQLQEIAQQGPIQKNMGKFGGDLLNIAREVLAAALAEKKGDMTGMFAHYKKAIQLQDNLGYTEPPSWCFPVREALGNAFLKLGQADKAEAAFRQDLKQYPQNGWALFGLVTSLKRQGKNSEANQAEHALKKAWHFADIAYSPQGGP